MRPEIRRLTTDQFLSLLASIHATLTRKIDAVHLHHTWRPNRAQFRGLASIEATRTYHIGLGWDDIGQHLTIDPFGISWTGRNWNLPPASQKGKNGKAGRRAVHDRDGRRLRHRSGRARRRAAPRCLRRGRRHPRPVRPRYERHLFPSRARLAKDLSRDRCRQRAARYRHSGRAGVAAFGSGRRWRPHSGRRQGQGERQSDQAAPAPTRVSREPRRRGSGRRARHRLREPGSSGRRRVRPGDCGRISRAGRRLRARRRGRGRGASVGRVAGTAPACREPEPRQAVEDRPVQDGRPIHRRHHRRHPELCRVDAIAAADVARPWRARGREVGPQLRAERPTSGGSVMASTRCISSGKPARSRSSGTGSASAAASATGGIAASSALRGRSARRSGAT